MGKKWFKVLSLSLLCLGAGLTSACGCNKGKVKVTFVTEGNSDIIKYVKKGKTLQDIPTPPGVKGKYCLWPEVSFKNIQEDMVVVANCYSTVTNMVTNMPSTIDVQIDTPEATLEYIFKDIEVDVTFESGETRKLYDGEYTIEASGYNSGISGSYTVGIVYNNARKNITINVNKIKDYVTVSTNGGQGYYSEGLPELVANTSVKGSVSFDAGQILTVGNNEYSWTFVPEDLNKYDIVKGKINVYLIKAKSISTNKSSIRVEYGSTKAQIIQELKDGLVVEALYGESFYRQIDERFYTIDSTDFVVDRSGVFTFRVKYDEKTYADISVVVNKYDAYSLDVAFSTSGTEYYYDENDTLEELEQYLTYTAIGIDNQPITGTLVFEENQILSQGSFSYNYIFTPNDTNYAVKTGEVIVNV